MRRVGIAIAIVGLAVLAGGCGGNDEPPRSALAEQLAQLCDEARADTEALGLPADKGFVVMKPTAARGIRLAESIGKLEGATPTEKQQIAALAKDFGFYYESSLPRSSCISVADSEIYAITLSRAKPSLERAEALAIEMGAPECAVRPFPDR